MDTDKVEMLTINETSNLFPKISALLLPLVTNIDEREMWLTQAYYLTDPRLYYMIKREGSALEFVTNCLKTAFDYGCFADGTHALAVLLEAIRNGVDVTIKQQIDELVPQCNALCTEGVLPPALTPDATTAHRSQLLQTIVTPESQRTPTIFVSYARADSQLVQQLINDLQDAGHAVWIDTTNIKSDESWSQAISAGINNSYAFVSVISKSAYSSKWVEREYHWADQKKKLRIFAVQIEDCELPIYMIERQVTRLFPEYRSGLQKLLGELPSPLSEDTLTETTTSTPRPASQRTLELEYLDRLRLEDWLKTLKQAEQYTPMAGTVQVSADTSALIPTKYKHMRNLFAGDMDTGTTQESQENTDIIKAIREMHRVVLLGEPGAGKTTTLWKLAKDMIDTAAKNPTAPLPILVRLGKWVSPNQPLSNFIKGDLGRLGPYLDTLIETKRVALLLDGLNEIPVAQRRVGKLEEVKNLLDTAQRYNPDLISVVSCRERDYTFDLGFDRIEITPLDPPRIHEFTVKRLGQAAGEALFWKLVGGAEVRRVWDIWRQNGATLDLFFSADEVPREEPRIFTITSAADDDLWREKVKNPESLMTLAENPYMLMMITDLYGEKGTLPDNRGELFTQFIDELIEREAKTNKHMTAREGELLRGLAKLAYAMQSRPDAPDAANSGTDSDSPEDTAIPLEEVKADLLDDELLYLASSASLLNISDTVSFSHQLLQEYFAATHIFHEIKAGRLTATDLWPADRWWELTGWEEAIVLLAGLFSADCTFVLDWIQQANPEVAAQCIIRSGAHTPLETKDRLRTAWIPRLTDLTGDPDPRARAAVGRALGLTRLDNRPGVSHFNWDADYWRKVSAGTFEIATEAALDHQSADSPRTVPLPSDFWMGKYPVTYAQFRLFFESPQGYWNNRWWLNLHPDGLKLRHKNEQEWKIYNHPVETISWYDAMAFCQWLTAEWQIGRISLPKDIPTTYVIRLPAEDEWSKTARWSEGERKSHRYAWGDEYRLGYANFDETGVNGVYLRQTSAVGIYPQGASAYGITDLCGNIWEWTLTDYDTGSSDEITNNKPRTLRGGAWGNYPDDAQASSRVRLSPSIRLKTNGFRIVAAPPIQKSSDTTEPERSNPMGG